MLNTKHMHKSALIVSIICLVFSIFACKVGDFDETVDYTITYYYNKDDGSVVTSSFTNHVKKGTYLTGGPTSWSNGVWSTKEEIGFGYVGDGKIGTKNVFYKYVIKDKVWYFEQIENVGWDSTQAINTSLSLMPKYETVESSESVDFDMIYNAPSETEEIGYSINVEPRSYKTSDVENNTVFIRDVIKDFGIFELTKDNDIAYGYVDNSDHKHKYYFDSVVQPAGYDNTKPKYEFTLYDRDGKKLGDYDTDDLVTMDFDGNILKPKYLSAGYANIPQGGNSVPGGISYIDQVFIPGNKNPDGSLSPFPYSAAGSSKYYMSENRSVKWTDISDFSAFYTDTTETKLPVNNMYAMQTPMLSSLLYSLVTSTDNNIKTLLNNGSSSVYTLSDNFKNNLTSNTNILGKEILTYLSYFDAVTIANVLTDYYNFIHPNEPLTHVYHQIKVADVAANTIRATDSSSTSAGTPNYWYEYPTDYNFTKNTKWKSAKNSYLYMTDRGNGTQTNYDKYKDFYYLASDDSATGFRLPRDYEWEYMARIVTDERQVPNPDVRRVNLQNTSESFDTVIAPDNANNYKYYFQSAKGSFDLDSVGAAYVGSGSGLALWDGSKYNRTALRPYTKAVGKVTIADTSHSNTQKATRTSRTGSFLYFDANGKDDANRKNGAGLYGMCNGVREYCDTFASSLYYDTSDIDKTNTTVVMRGSTRESCSSIKADFCSLGSNDKNWINTPVEGETCGVRFIRYVFD